MNLGIYAAIILVVVAFTAVVALAFRVGKSAGLREAEESLLREMANFPLSEYWFLRPIEIEEPGEYDSAVIVGTVKWYDDQLPEFGMRAELYGQELSEWGSLNEQETADWLLARTNGIG